MQAVCNCRSGKQMKPLIWTTAVCCLVLTMGSCNKPVAAPAPRKLLCYVGGTMRPAMETLARLYQEQTGRAVELDFGDSGQCLVKIESTRVGDLYVAHDPFPARAEMLKLADRRWELATLRP